MSVYLDASVIIPLLIAETFTDAVIVFMAEVAEPIVSDFAVAEVVSAISSATRSSRLSRELANDRLEAFDRWRGHSARLTRLSAGDVSDATLLVPPLRVDAPRAGCAPSCVGPPIGGRAGDARRADGAGYGDDWATARLHSDLTLRNTGLLG